MSFDYTTVPDGHLEERPLRFKASCKDCDWVNRRNKEQYAENSAASHRRENIDHRATVERDAITVLEADQ